MSTSRSKREKSVLKWGEWLDACQLKESSLLTDREFTYYNELLFGLTLPDWGNLPLCSITSEMINSLMQEYGKDRSISSRRLVLKLIRRAFQRAVDAGLLLENPCKSFEVRYPRIKKRELTTGEIELFLDTAERTESDYFPLWEFAVSTGMRLSELSALKRTDINFKSRLVKVSRSWNEFQGFRVSNEDRSIPVPYELLSLIKEREKSAELKSEYVFFGLMNKGRYRHSTAIRNCCVSAGIVPFHFHDLRAAYIAHLLKDGVSPIIVMRLAGISSVLALSAYQCASLVKNHNGGENAI